MSSAYVFAKMEKVVFLRFLQLSIIRDPFDPEYHGQK